MKILMTGFTPRAVGSTKLLYSYMSNTSVITKTLAALGHEVDHRIVDVEEPGLPQKYDVALIGLAVPQSLSSRYVYGALWAAEQFGLERCRFYVDDWLLHQFQSQLESGIRGQEKRFYSLSNRHCFEAAQRHTSTWDKWFKILARQAYNLLIPAFPWARTETLLPKLPKVTGIIMDPSPLALTDTEVFYGSKDPINLAKVAPADRERQWILAAMRDVKPWLDKNSFGWPVVKYGNKRQGEEILEEKKLVSEIYPRNWGIIGAPYPVVTGGGGWRARYIHSAVTKSILFLDPDEGRRTGGPFNVYRTVVEKMSDEQLIDLAERQSEHLLSRIWTLRDLHERVDSFVKENK